MTLQKWALTVIHDSAHRAGVVARLAAPTKMCSSPASTTAELAVYTASYRFATMHDGTGVGQQP